MALSENMKLIETTGNVSDFDEEAEKAVDAGKTLKSGNMYVTSRADVDELGGTSDLQNYLIPAGSVTDEIYQGDWTIIYDTGEDSVNNDKVTYRSPSILAVYYTPQSSGIFDGDDGYYSSFLSDDSDGDFPYSNKEARLSTFDGQLGYYDGKASEELSSTQKTEDDFICWYEVDNGEELLVHVYVNVPNEDKYIKNTKILNDINIHLTLAGSKGTVTLDEATLKDATVNDTPKTRTIGTKVVPYVADYTFVLDSLRVESSTTDTSSKRKQFKKLTYTDKEGNEKSITSIITPGENIGLSVAADCNGYEASFLSIDEYKPVKVVNTLYAKSAPAKDGNGTTSYESIEVSCGRHLQNLDRSLSGYATTKDEVRVKLTDNIDFAKDSEEGQDNQSWYATYGNASFYPINNNKIATFDGKGKSISNLVITEETEDASEGKQSCKMTAAGKAAIEQTDSGTDNATKAVQNHKNNNGLFAVFYGYKLENITLINPIVNCTTAKNAGAIAGTLAGEIVDNSKTIAINKCGVHLDYDEASKSENEYLKNTNVNGTSWNTANNTVWIKGNTCIGGLVGKVEATGGKVAATGLTITNSYSATVVKAGMAKSYGGGLVGQSTLKMDVDTSYADCYISAGNVGGLAGDVVANTSFKDCYSAGFVLRGIENRVGELVERAAGYTPSDVNVTLSGNNYSLFNYDDVTSTAFKTTTLTFKDDGVVDNYPDSTALENDTVADTKIVGFFAPKATFADTSEKAYFTYGDLASATGKGVGEYKPVSDMKKQETDGGLGLSSKAISGENPTEISYNLSLQYGQPNYTSGYINRHKLTLPVFWNNNKTDAPQNHYGDWLEKPGSKVKKYKINFVDVRNDNVVKTDEITTDEEEEMKKSIFRSFTNGFINEIRMVSINNVTSDAFSFNGFDLEKSLASGTSPKYQNKGVSWRKFISENTFTEESDLTSADGKVHSINVYLHWKVSTYSDFEVSNASDKRMQDGDNVVLVGLKYNSTRTNKEFGYALIATTRAPENDNASKLGAACELLSLSSEYDALRIINTNAFKDYIWNVSTAENFLKKYPDIKGGDVTLDDTQSQGLVIYSTICKDGVGKPYIFALSANSNILEKHDDFDAEYIWYYEDGSDKPYENRTSGTSTVKRYLVATYNGGKLTVTKNPETEGRGEYAKIYRSGRIGNEVDVETMKLIENVEDLKE